MAYLYCHTSKCIQLPQILNRDGGFLRKHFFAGEFGWKFFVPSLVDWSSGASIDVDEFKYTLLEEGGFLFRLGRKLFVDAMAEVGGVKIVMGCKKNYRRIQEMVRISGACLEIRIKFDALI